MSQKFKNDRKTAFLGGLPDTSLESATNDISARSKFNFSYFHEDPAGQKFADWTHAELVKLLEKLKDYSREPLNFWRSQRVGGGVGRVLAIYGDFPTRSDFKWPKHVPIEAQWGRFRLESAVRLVGFVVPDRFDKSMHKTGHCFDSNTFYVVFLDGKHLFYKTEDK